jgi:hypothetical protein
MCFVAAVAGVKLAQVNNGPALSTRGQVQEFFIVILFVVIASTLATLAAAVVGSVAAWRGTGSTQRAH